MIHIYFGKSASGKDTFAKKLINCANTIKPLVSYTSRPKREGEIDGVDYNFVSREEFLKMLNDGKFIESRIYNTLVNGKPDTWYYGTPRVNSEEHWVTVLDIQGIKSFIEAYGIYNIMLTFIIS